MSKNGRRKKIWTRYSDNGDEDKEEEEDWWKKSSKDKKQGKGKLVESDATDDSSSNGLAKHELPHRNTKRRPVISDSPEADMGASLYSATFSFACASAWSRCTFA